MSCIMIVYIHHPEAFVHFFLQVFDNILYVGQNRITLTYNLIYVPYYFPIFAKLRWIFVIY